MQLQTHSPRNFDSVASLSVSRYRLQADSAVTVQAVVIVAGLANDTTVVVMDLATYWATGHNRVRASSFPNSGATVAHDGVVAGNCQPDVPLMISTKVKGQS